MKEVLINFETAKLAKEKGFDSPVIYGYRGLGVCTDIVETDYGADFINQYKNLNDIEVSDTEKDIENWEEWVLYSAPTQSLLQKWLREEHNIEVFVHLRTYHVGWVVKVRDMKNTSTLFQNVYETYEDALENGLYEALLIIK